MPKIVDHKERRVAIAKAACQAIAKKGFDRVTMVDIAKEAGVTTGMTSNYFASKEEIIEAALRISFANLKARLAERVKDQATKGTVDLCKILEAAIPIDDTHFAEFVVWVGFWGKIASNPEYQQLNHRLHKEGVSVYEQAIRTSWPESLDWSDAVFEHVLRSILTFLFGLNAGGVTNLDIWTPAMQRAQLCSHLELIRDWGQRTAAKCG